MAEADIDAPSLKKRIVRRRIAAPSTTITRAGIAGQRAMREAVEAGLLDSEQERFSFRVPKALVAAAKRESGIATDSELGRVALAMLAQADPFAEFFKRTEGVLGPDHDLDY